MTDMDCIVIQGKPIWFPGWQSVLDMPGDSMDYCELEGNLELWGGAVECHGYLQ